MKSRVPIAVCMSALALAGLGGILYASYQARKVVGARLGKGVVVNTGETIDPEGKLTIFSSRPVDAVLSHDGKRVYLKENEGLTVVGGATGEVLERLPIKGGSSLTGLALSADGANLYYSNSASAIVEVDTNASPMAIKRTFTMPKPKVGGDAYPCGLAVANDKLYAALNRSNQVAEIDLSDGVIRRTFDVDPGPFSLVVDADAHEVWVSSWGKTPKSGDLSSLSSGTPVTVDSRGIGNGGVVTRIDLVTGKKGKGIPVGIQPCEVALGGSLVLVACANSDAVFGVDRKLGTAKRLWKGEVSSAPSSLSVLEGGDVAVACGGSNEVVVLKDGTYKPTEVYRSAWYPIAVRSRGEALYVASAKGLGSRGNDLQKGKFDEVARTEKFKKPLTELEAKALGVYQFTGVLSIIPRSSDAPEVPTGAPASQPARPGTKAVPVPERPGEPSVFKHVIYVLKENRTYDQVFGDMAEGDGDPALCTYGANITPNHHALAKEFVLLDNYYCNGVLSADGHSWSTEGNATTYFERSFGGWTRSYPFGDDPLAISGTGHIWDAVLDKGLTFKNYGEYNYSEPSKGEKYLTVLRDFTLGARKVKIKHKIAIPRLRKYSDPDCPGWNMEIPDVLRASYFLRDLKAADKNGKFPSFNFVYLPQDHTSGAGPGVPDPTAHLADNDLALGRIVDAVSHSKYWKDTVIFVIEDDPQAGFDHVDGHRSLCLVVSPYTRRKAVVSTFYNQAGVLKTMQHILGLKPVTRYEMEANLMSQCFQSTPNLTPYKVRPNLVPLDKMYSARSAFKALDFSKPDLADEDEFNRQLWAAAKGDVPYPAAWAGAHGRGLTEKGLSLDELREDDD